MNGKVESRKELWLRREDLVREMVATGKLTEIVPIEIPGSPLHSWSPPVRVRRVDGEVYFSGGANTPSGLLPGETFESV